MAKSTDDRVKTLEAQVKALIETLKANGISLPKELR